MTAGRTHDLIVALIVRTAGGQWRFLATTRLADGRLVGGGNDVRSDSALQHKLNWRWPMCQYPSLRAGSLKKSAFLSEDRSRACVPTAPSVGTFAQSLSFATLAAPNREGRPTPK